MSTTTAGPARMLPGARTWFGYLGGALAWTAHLLGSYAIAEFGCVGDTPRWLGITSVSWLLLGLTALLLAVSGAATLVAARSRPKLGTRNPGGEGAAHLSRAGVIMSGLFALIIVVQSIPIFYYLESC